MSRGLLGRLFVGGLLAAGAWAFIKYAERKRRGRGGKARDGEARGGEGVDGVDARHGLSAEEFFALPRDTQISMIILMLLGTGCGDLERKARETGRLDALQALWVDILKSKDSRMDRPTFDTVTRFRPDGTFETEKANERVDDSELKELLLYQIRDSLEPDSPHLEGMFEAFHTESAPWTRMRIVRAVGRIGGDRALAFLESVVQDESGTLAAQEAEKYLS